MLADSRMERAGRACKPAQPQPAHTTALTRTAALVIVGDEILAAKVQDLNTHFLCSELRAIGWRVCKASVVLFPACWALHLADKLALGKLVYPDMSCLISDRQKSVYA